MPQDDLGGVLAGRLTLPQALTPFTDGFDIIAGRSGSGRLGSAPVSRLQHLCQNLVGMSRDYDMVVLDLGAGVEQTVRQLTQNVDTCLVVVTDEPTSLTDAYAFIKVAHADRPDADLRIVVNVADSGRDGERTYSDPAQGLPGVLEDFTATAGDHPSRPPGRRSDPPADLDHDPGPSFGRGERC